MFKYSRTKLYFCFFLKATNCNGNTEKSPSSYVFTSPLMNASTDKAFNTVTAPIRFSFRISFYHTKYNRLISTERQITFLHNPLSFFFLSNITLKTFVMAES